MSHRDIALQVMWNRLISVVEEQAQTLVRTAFSTSTREAGDVSAGVFDLDGLDFSVFMAAFTAVMASLGLARDFFPAGQIVLIVVSAIAGGLIGLAAWRLLPKRGVPILAPAAIVTCVVALLLGLFG